MNTLLLNTLEFTNEDNIKVDVKEYASKIFKKIRSFESLTEDDLME